MVTGPLSSLVSSSAPAPYPFFSSSSGCKLSATLAAAYGLGGKSKRDIILFIFFRYVKSISQMQP